MDNLQFTIDNGMHGYFFMSLPVLMIALFSTMRHVYIPFDSFEMS